MTVTTRKQENSIDALYRVQIEANGIIIWQIASESGHTYYVTMTRGQHVSSCERSDGESCQGWKYRHSCHHATLARMRERGYQDDREAEERATMDAFRDEIAAAPSAHERMMVAPLNGDRAFSLTR